MLGQPVSMLIPAGGRLQAARPAARGGDRHRPGADRHRDAAQEGRGRQVRRVLRRRPGRRCRWPTAPPSPTWPRSTAPPAASSRSTPRRCATCASPAGREAQVAAGRGVLPRSRACSTPPTTPEADLLRHAGAGPGTVEPSLAGPDAAAGPRAAERRQEVVRRRAAGAAGKAKPKAGAAAGRTPDVTPRSTHRAVDGSARRAAARLGGHRRHHQLHEHVEPVGDAGGRPAGQEGRRARPADQAVGQDQPGARLEGGDRLPDRGRPDAAAGAAAASTWSATAARPASATAGRCRRRSRKAIEDGDLVVAAVLSGNRNFEGRVHPEVRANYLASPPLVVAYALAGRMDIDLHTEPLGHGHATASRSTCKDIWPTQEEVHDAGRRSRSRSEMFHKEYGDVFEGDEHWQRAAGAGGRPVRLGRRTRTYVKHPPYFEDMAPSAGAGRRTSTAPACWRCWATASRPTTSRRPARSRRTARPAST